MRGYCSMILALALVLGHSVAGSAQSLPFTLSPAVPNQEVSIGAGLCNANGGFVMGRFTRNMNEWFAMEISVDGRGRDTGRAYGLAIIDLRLLGYDDRHPKWYFLTVGAAQNLGPDDTSSPMIGGGLQSVWHGPIAVRADLQVFPSGLSSEGHGRLVLSLALGLPDLR
jgi:hypothetical protein